MVAEHWQRNRALQGRSIQCLWKESWIKQHQHQHHLQRSRGCDWLGTSGGLYRLTRQVVTAYSTANGLLNNEVYPILQTRDDDIWIGSITGLSRFHDEQFHNTLLPRAHQIVQSLAE